MKKALLIASAVAATSVFAIDSNEISFLPVTPPKANGMMLLAIPFNGYGTDDSASIAVADVLLTSDLDAEDKIYIPRGEVGKYDEYTLSSDKTVWGNSRVVEVKNGSITAASGTPADEAKVARGTAFWLKSSRATEVKLLGQAATQVPTSVTTSRGFQLLAPTTSENDILISSFSDASKGDVVLLANGVKYKKAKSGWKKVHDGTSPIAEPTGVTASDKILAGTGFWYAAQSDSTELSL